MPTERQTVNVIPDKIEKSDSQPAPVVESSQEEIEGRARIAEFMGLPVEQRVARMATILDRGIINDRLRVTLPDDLHGEWCRNDPMEIDSMKALGFWVDTTYASNRALHADGSSAHIIGDTIHIVTTKDNKNLIDTIRAEQARRVAGLSKRQREEEDFAGNTQRDTGGVIPTFFESNTKAVTANDVRSALANAGRQTKVQR